jgi:nucleoporin NUP42
MAVVADYFSQDSMRSDLSTDKPLWPLSVYGPAKHEPNIIFGLDESMEELRVRAASALKAGNVNEYVSHDFCDDADPTNHFLN